MITWRDILQSLNSITDDRLDDPAVIVIGDELIPIDVLEIEIPEIGDNRLMAFPVANINPQ